MLIPNWKAPDNIKALTICADDQIDKIYNINIIDSIPDNLIWMNQIHSNTVLNYSNQNQLSINLNNNINLIKNHFHNNLQETYISSLIKADAITTNQKNIGCVIKTADCLPIFVTDNSGSRIAAIHAGWRGLANNIIANTIEQYNSNNLIIWIGPGICAEHFIVDADVKNIFTNIDNANNKYFKSCNNYNKFSADLLGIAVHQLLKLNIKYIFTSNLCTYCDNKQFFSYRRDGKTTGRLLNIIWLT